MTESELIAIIEGEESQAISTQSGLLSEQRRKAIQYYYGQPYGNEVDGRSQVVTSEVLDAIEGMLPTLLAIFTASDEVIRFEAQNPDDEEAASQATDYINYVFSRANNGFLVLYCLIKDALMLKNGFTKIYWEEYEDRGNETYEGLTDEQFYGLMQDETLELVAHTQTEVPGMPQVFSHDAKFTRTKKNGRVCLDPVPPDEILISRETPNDLKKARFIEHRKKMTITEIREMGFDVDEDISDASDQEFNKERVERYKFDDAIQFSEDHGGMDKTTREVWVHEAYLYVDYDGDGYAELRKVTKIGHTILKFKDGREANEEMDSIPFITATPVLMPHKIYGMSIADLIMDIQLTKSTITRQLLDNAYLANNGRYEALDGMVNMDDLLTNRPGGIVRVKTLGAVKRIDTPLLGQPAFELLGYFDSVKNTRLGFNPQVTGTDVNALNNTAHGAELEHQANKQRVELIARIIAETGVKDMFYKILELTSKHSTKAQTVKLRGKWVNVDPREWLNKFNMTVTVGLGTGSQSLTLQSAMGVLQVQAGMMSQGLMNRTVTEQNIYEAARLFAKASNPKHADTLFTNPQTMGPRPPPPPDPKIVAGLQKAQMTTQQRDKKSSQDFILKVLQMAQQKNLTLAQLEAQVKNQQADRIHDHLQASADRHLEADSMQQDGLLQALALLQATNAPAQ